MSRTAVNKKARQKIAEIAMDKNLTRCEIKLAGCMGEAHAPAHRHKRSWYNGKPDKLLWDFNQWVAACQACHHKIEYDRDLTEQVFRRLRDEKT